MIDRRQLLTRHTWQLATSSAVSRTKRAFLRKEQHYPTFYYRYSHDIAHVFGLRIFGIYALNGIVKIRWWLVIVNLTLILAPIPAGLLATQLNSSSPQQIGTSVVWTTYFSLIALVAQAFSYGGVRVFHNLTPFLQQCLTRRGMKRYEGWASVSTALLPQVVWALLWSSLGCLALYALSTDPNIAAALPITWASYFSVGITVVYLSGGTWWVFAGSILSYRITGLGCLNLLPYAPAATPGVELLVRCYRLGFAGACIGVTLCLTPILVAVSVLPATLLTIGIATLLVAFSFLALVAVVVIPDWMLSKAILRERHLAIQNINAQLPQRPNFTTPVSAKQEYLMVWLQTLVTTPGSTVSGSVIATIAIAFLSTTTPVLVSFFISPSL